MSISEQVKELREASDAYSGEGFYEFSNMVKQAADTIESLSDKLSVENSGAWILCKERLPEKNETVIACTQNGTFAAQYNGIEWYRENMFGYDSALREIDVIAWKLLPEPYHEP